MELPDHLEPGDLNMSPCPECWALVREDDQVAHEVWHQDLTNKLGR